ncbi:uncharacterized protein LOC108623735 [Ceratina calcarata]|uniref:Uncharacterized protein LOC108623735 n=1 Tax=Ceratina calcarata TaxID=156304 RepID=A0AAJ7IVJ8_9HYME|nr:uncharacterized protein LOC108623735 [Ceratina calcarata]
MNDDPKEVLALLNSLGFVGITAQQLKDFMKDLKLYRKVKDRERQQRKEEIRRRIIDKQRNVIREILTEQKTEFRSIENTFSTNSSSSYIDTSFVKVRVKCMSSDKENINSANSEENYENARSNVDMIQLKSKPKRAQDHYSIKSSSVSCDNEDEKLCLNSRNKCGSLSKKNVHIEKQSRTKLEHDDVSDTLPKSNTLHSARPMSAPNILEHRECVASSQTKSTSSTRNTKSFIRPWRLQPEVQKNLSARKSDPVTLYQRYQQEWKQMSFPGEAKHSSIRWAIREKMLGTDPHPMPLPKKSVSMPTLKRK